MLVNLMKTHGTGRGTKSLMPQLVLQKQALVIQGNTAALKLLHEQGFNEYLFLNINVTNSHSSLSVNMKANQMTTGPSGPDCTHNFTNICSLVNPARKEVS